MGIHHSISASETDGVHYRRAALWEIILSSCGAICGMSIYILIGLASYSASIGYGITTTIIGVILMGTRILDAVTDPLLAFLYDRVNTRFGKIRLLLILGYAVEALALWGMFTLLSSKGHGIATFCALYIVYVIGYTISNMTAQTIGPLLTNDPKQRPILGVWNTAFNYLVPTALSIILNVVILARYGTYNQGFLSAACALCLTLGLVGTVLQCIGASRIDKPENFRGTLARQEHLSVRDMISVLKYNRPLQCYIASAASDKIAQQVASQSIIVTLLSGVVIGNMGLSTILSAISMLPSIIFAIFAAHYAGQNGSRKGIVRWTEVCIAISIVLLVFFAVIDPKKIAVMMSIPMILYVAFTIILNGSKVCVSTCNAAFMADIIDYELDRSGKYIPAVVAGTYSLIDKLISSVSSVIATGCIALVGYTTTVPQPGDTCTTPIFLMTMFLSYGLAILGWICTLVAMRFCHLDREAMIGVQKRIEARKEELKKEEIR